MAEKLKEAFIDDAPEPPAPQDPRVVIGQDAQIITTISLDLQFRNIVNVNVKQYDTELRAIRICVTDQGVPVDTSDYSNAYVQVRRPDGSFIVNTLSVLPSYYVLEISRAMVELSGICKADVTITDGYGVATTMTFFLNVDASVITADEYEDIPEFQALVAYRNQAQASAEAAAESESNAATSEENAATSEANASDSADSAAASATAAASSASSAAQSANSAASSANLAKDHKDDAYSYAEAAGRSANIANGWASNAEGSANTADARATLAAQMATNAETAATNAATSASNAATSETNAETARGVAVDKAIEASGSAIVAKSWSVGPSAQETSGTDTNNAKYWAEQAQQAATSIDADNVTYDNTASGLTATNIQDATDEIADAIPFKFGIDSQGNYGYYKEGESQITPFKAGAEGTLPVNPSSTTGMNIWIITNLEDTSDTADIVY